MKTKDLTVKRLLSCANRLWAGVDRSDPKACWIWPRSRTAFGYGKFQIGAKITINAHRVAYFITHPSEWPSGLVVMHSCDNPPCINPAHLSLGNHAHNAQDRSKKGRSGHPMHNAKIDMATANEIRAIYAKGGLAMKELAVQYGMSFGEVQRIIQNTRWIVKPSMPEKPRLFLHV